MSRCRKFVACTKATAVEKSRSPSMASACRAASTIALCASTNSNSACPSSFTCRPRRAITRKRSASSRSSKLFVLRGCSIPISTCGPLRAKSTTLSTKPASALAPTSACLLPRSRRKWRKTSPIICLIRGFVLAICIPTSQRSSASRFCAICAVANSTCLWASTCCARASTCPKCRLWPFSTPIKRAFCATTAALFRQSAALRETTMAM